MLLSALLEKATSKQFIDLLAVCQSQVELAHLSLNKSSTSVAGRTLATIELVEQLVRSSLSATHVRALHAQLPNYFQHLGCTAQVLVTFVSFIWWAMWAWSRGTGLGRS